MNNDMSWKHLVIILAKQDTAGMNLAAFTAKNVYFICVSSPNNSNPHNLRTLSMNFTFL